MKDTTAANQSTSLTEGGLWRIIWLISWPMLLMMLLHFLVGLTDVYVAGLISPDVQAAVGFVSQIFFLVIILGNAVSIGTVSLVARAVGAGDRVGALMKAKQSLLFGLLLSCILTGIILLWHEQIIALAGFPPVIRGIAVTFLRIFAFALVPNYLLIISSAVFRASGEVRKPLLTMSVFTVANIAGDFGLVFGLGPFPEMGYAGIAVATAAAAAVGMAVNLLFFAGDRWRSLYGISWRLSGVLVKSIIRLSWPAAMLQVAWNAGSIVLYNILGRLGAESVTALASITNGLRIEAIIFLPAFAFNMAASVLVGQNLGAGNARRAEEVGWKIATAGMIFVSAMALIVFIGARYWASLLTGDPAVLDETVRYLRINMFSEPFMALSLILSGGLQGAGDTRGTMWVIITAMWAIRLPLAYLLVLVLGGGGVGE